MINTIIFKNYKCFKKLTFNANKLNILLGLNSSGKSTLIQTIHMFIKIASMNDNTQTLAEYMRRPRLNNLYEFAETDIFSISLNTSPAGRNSIECTYSNSGLTFKRDSNFKTKVDYISSDRLGPTLQHASIPSILGTSDKLGTSGEYTASYLLKYGAKHSIDTNACHPSAKTNLLLDQVNAWLGEISPNIQIEISEPPMIDKVLLKYRYELSRIKTTPLNPNNVGWGLSYVLPIITSLLIACIDNNEYENVLIIESPESHIHPKGQAALGHLIALASNYKTQIFVETHSDHIINGIRVAAKKSKVDNKKINISFLYRKTEHNERINAEEIYSDVEYIKIDKNGELSSYPQDFLDQWDTQLMELL